MTISSVLVGVLEQGDMQKKVVSKGWFKESSSLSSGKVCNLDEQRHTYTFLQDCKWSDA